MSLLWLLEPYCIGSHQLWAEGYARYSRHRVVLLTMPGRFWKWRMHGGAVTLARLARQQWETEGRPHLLLVSDMLDLPAFLGLTRDFLADVPVALYFHENQLTYPLPPGEKRDLHYAFINYTSALAADRVFFNSAYHRESFLAELPRLLKHFPDYNELWTIEALRAKSRVLPLGLDLGRHDAYRPSEKPSGPPVLLWNHRWEYDKNPADFFRALYTLADEGYDFRLILAGANFRQRPEEFLEARQRLRERILHFGYAEDPATYSRLLWQADIVVSTAIHEFFGAAVVEALYCGCFPVLPNRLVYPELLPAQCHALCLYDDFAGLLDRLRWALEHMDQVRQIDLRPVAARYDWGNLAPRYDELLEDNPP